VVDCWAVWIKAATFNSISRQKPHLTIRWSVDTVSLVKLYAKSQLAKTECPTRQLYHNGEESIQAVLIMIGDKHNKDYLQPYMKRLDSRDTLQNMLSHNDCRELYTAIGLLSPALPPQRAYILIMNLIGEWPIITVSNGNALRKC